MTNYEVLYVLSPKAEESDREELIARFQNVVAAAGGTAEVNRWGMRKLAYKIDFQSEGFYVLMSFSAPESLPAELERQMRITDSVMRFMVTKKVENKLTRAEEERKAKAAEKAAAAAKAREEAAAAAVAEAAASENGAEEFEAGIEGAEAAAGTEAEKSGTEVFGTEAEKSETEVFGTEAAESVAETTGTESEAETGTAESEADVQSEAVETTAAEESE